MCYDEMSLHFSLGTQSSYKTKETITLQYKILFPKDFSYYKNIHSYSYIKQTAQPKLCSEWAQICAWQLLYKVSSVSVKHQSQYMHPSSLTLGQDSLHKG